MSALIARCAGSSGGAQPPHEDPSKLPALCESAQPATSKKRKGRGPAKGNEIHHRLAHGKIHVDFDEEDGTWKALDDDGSLYDSAVGILTRCHCDPFYDSWTKIPVEQRTQVLDGLLNWFDIDYTYQNGVYRAMVERDAKKCYRDWKSDLHDHFKEVGGLENLDAAKEKVPKNVRDPSHWRSCCDRFSSAKFRRKSQTNSGNRSEHSWESKQGRISYARHRAKKVNPQTQEPISLIDNWRDMHKKGDVWVNSQAAETYRLLQERATLAAASTERCIDERAIMEETFGRRRGHMTGVGPSLSRGTTTATQTSAANFAGVPAEEYQRVIGELGQLDLQTATRSQLVDLVAHMRELFVQLAPNMHQQNILPQQPSISSAHHPDGDDDHAEDLSD